MSEERSASGGNVVKKKALVIVNAANVRDAFSGVPNLMEDALSAITTPSPSNGKRYGNSWMTTMMHAMAGKTVSGKFESVDL